MASGPTIRRCPEHRPFYRPTSLIWPLKFQSIIDQNNFSKLHVWSSLCPSCHPAHHSRLHSELLKNAHKTVHHLASPLLFQTLWTPPVTLPTLQPSWTIGNCPRTPRPPMLQAVLHVCSFSWGGLSHLTCSNSPFKTLFKYSLHVLQLPQAVNVSVTFDFLPKQLCLHWNFYRFPEGGKKFHTLLFKVVSLHFPSEPWKFYLIDNSKVSFLETMFSFNLHYLLGLNTLARIKSGKWIWLLDHHMLYGTLWKCKRLGEQGSPAFANSRDSLKICSCSLMVPCAQLQHSLYPRISHHCLLLGLPWKA